MKPISRIVLALASLSLISTYFLPLWQIQLWAPQYPEGLNMKIWHNHLSGAFDIINGLNHYIGMKLIKEEMFPELGYIGILIGIYIAIGLLAAISGKKLLLKVFILTGLLYGVAALYDFYQWGYDYGHNLDPNAAIKVPGMSYQPPVVGYKNLLNFTAYSGPDKGGWVIISASLIAILILFFEFRNSRPKNQTKSGAGKMAAAAALLAVFLFSSCSSGGPVPIRIGKDECSHCKMTITDQKFGAEAITKTNKVFKFDDVNCLVNYMNGDKNFTGQVKDIYIVDFVKAGSFVAAGTAFFLHAEDIKSPMGGSVAAFSSEADRKTVQQEFSSAEPMTWEKVRSLY
ncbi:MAG: nitrous oxide reductase accessory protein NosL [Bacteroidia bacterium]|nr:nitrous oxide reductase accessory protein NosL [Bacteroidia bacterium]